MESPLINNLPASNSPSGRTEIWMISLRTMRICMPLDNFFPAFTVTLPPVCRVRHDLAVGVLSVVVLEVVVVWVVVWVVESGVYTTCLVDRHPASMTTASNI